VSEREDRIAANEVLYRNLNERLRDTTLELSGPGLLAPSAVQIVCECGRTDCMAKIDVPLGTYERVRSVPTRFFIAPGHEIPDVERVVERDRGFFVVEKHEEEAAIARATNPRS
jgi:hypothetical protein